VISSGLPQLVQLLSVTYRQLKGEQIAKYISGIVHNVIKQICTQNQGDNELSDTDPLPHRLVSPNQYNKSLLSESEETQANSESLSVGRQLTPMYTYGSVS